MLNVYMDFYDLSRLIPFKLSIIITQCVRLLFLGGYSFEM